MRARSNKNLDGALLSYKETAEKSNLGTSTVMRIARESGALIKIGHVSRVDWQIFYDFLRKNYGV